MLTLYKVLLQEGKVKCPEPLESKLMTQKFVNLQNTFCWPYELKREGQCVFSSQVCNVWSRVFFFNILEVIAACFTK